MPVAAPAAVAIIMRSSSPRKFISRTSSASWVEASEVMTKLSDSTANSGRTAGSP